MFVVMSTECSVDTDIAELPGTSPNSVDEVSFLRPLGTATWSGASGRRVRHVVYSMIGCPPLGSATYLLVRHTQGARKILAVRATSSTFPGINLARIRRSGARFGANEVHVFRGARTDEERRELAADLARGLRRRPGHATASTRRTGSAVAGTRSK